MRGRSDQFRNVDGEQRVRWLEGESGKGVWGVSRCNR